MIIDTLSNLITTIANKLGFTESLRVIKSNRPDLCDYQCDEVFKLAKTYHKSPIEIGEELVNKLNEIDFVFEEGVTTKATYKLKEYNKEFTIDIKTTKLVIKEDLIDINYRLDNSIFSFTLKIGG